MITTRRPIFAITAAVAVAALAACSTPRPQPDGGTVASPDSGTVEYKVGRPYRIAGTWYIPAEDFAYDETGIASWYGPNFHGRPTANGETFDSGKLTAAHRTLPLPSLVRVTNLDNGRQIVVRVNDRGPFARGRIIDLSRRSARLLGFERKGTARVRVQILAAESRALKARLTGAPVSPELRVAAARLQATRSNVPSLAPTPRIRVELVAELLPEIGEIQDGTSVAEPSVFLATRVPASDSYTAESRTAVGPTPAPITNARPWKEDSATNNPNVSIVSVRPTRIFVQAGAFAEPLNADRLRRRLKHLAPVRVDKVLIRGRAYYRVRMGPVDSVADGDRLLAAVHGAGIGSARLVVD